MENKVIINLADKDYIVPVNFKKSYQLTKFRNKLTYGIDFRDADKEILQEIADLQSDFRNDDFDMSKLSPEATQYLIEMSKDKDDIFNMEELIEMGMLLTDIEDENELLDIYDKEIEINGYDLLIAKLTEAISKVFMNAKGTSQQKTAKKKAK